MLVFIEVRVDRTTPEFFHKFRAGIRALDDIVECHVVAGGFDYLLKICVADMESYRRFLVERLSTLPGIVQINAYVALEEVKAAHTFKF